MSSATLQEGPLSEPAVVGNPDIGGVQIERVTFPNVRGQTTIAANLFRPSKVVPGAKLAAIVIGHPFQGVKEQTAGLHALRLAQRGFVTLAFDASHYGDSSGEPRYIEVPETRVGDYSACVDYLSNHSLVEKARIGVLGICGGGGYAVSAAKIDHRIKALATVSMYDMGRTYRQGLGDTFRNEQRMKLLDEVSEQRTMEAGGAPRRDVIAVSPPDDSPATPPIVREFYDYYATPRGQHAHSTGRFSFTSIAPIMNFFAFEQIEMISPRAVLFIVGERAESAYFSEDAYRRAAEPKELFVVPTATHVDLYDRPAFMAQSLDKLNAFFNQHLG